MPYSAEQHNKIIEQLKPFNATLVAVSKIRTREEIKQAYDLGQRVFGENYVQELVEKQQYLPADIQWHYIGHLQSNKVKYIAEFITLIHGVDKIKLLEEINKQAAKTGRKIKCLLQVHIAQEETKFGFDEEEISTVNPSNYPNVSICGMMGMATFSDAEIQIRNEFRKLKQLYDKHKDRFADFSVLSMGMSNDYEIALEEGSNMVRIGSLLFGNRNFLGK